MSAASFTSDFLATSPMRKASGKTMGKTGQEQGKVGRNHARTFAERVAAFLRAQHPLKTPQCVEAETGIPAGTVRKWLEQGNVPSGEAMLALSKRYEAPFLCAAYPDDEDAWFFEVARQQEQERLERKAEALLRQINDLRQGRA